MNKELSTVLKGKLSGLPFIDLLCGMVQTLTWEEPADENRMVTKKAPVTYDHNASNCEGTEIRPIPDSSRKSIIYFEDFGVNVIDKVHGLAKYQSSLRLVCWMNRAKLVGNHYTPVAGAAIALIVHQLANLNPYAASIFKRLAVKVAKIHPQEAAIFNRYTYKEEDRQYLRPPFEFFAIDFICDYFVDPQCLTTIQWNQTTCY